jgi:hypothetical protein
MGGSVEAVERLIPCIDEAEIVATEAILRQVTRMRRIFANRCLGYPM